MHLFDKVRGGIASDGSRGSLLKKEDLDAVETYLDWIHIQVILSRLNLRTPEGSNDNDLLKDLAKKRKAEAQKQHLLATILANKPMKEAVQTPRQEACDKVDKALYPPTEKIPPPPAAVQVRGGSSECLANEVDFRGG